MSKRQALATKVAEVQKWIDYLNEFERNTYVYPNYYEKRPWYHGNLVTRYLASVKELKKYLNGR